MARKQRCTRRFGGILGVLVVSMVAVVLAFALAATALNHLNVAHRVGDQLAAREMAESAIALAEGELLAEPTFGQAPGTGVQRHAWGQAQGVLSFDEAEAARLGIPRSTNNFGSDTPREGWSRNVPGDTVQLVGTGRVGGVTRHVEVLLYIPSYPHVLASTGPIQTEGVLVARVGDPAALIRAPSEMTPGELLPGDVASNSQVPEALRLGPRTRVTGDAQAAGGILVDPGAQVDGEIRPNWEPAGLPPIPLGNYDPEAQGRPGIEYLGGDPAGAPLRGYVVHRGDLLVAGDLALDGAVLYVDGDLTVRGGAVGVGAVIVRGATELRGGAALSADNKVALLSEGDLRIQGLSRQASAFRGVLYTEGDLSAQDITLVGNFVGNKPGGQGSRITLREADLVQGEGRIEFEIPPPLLPPKEVGVLSFIPWDPRDPGAEGRYLASLSDEEREAYEEQGDLPQHVLHRGNGTAISNKDSEGAPPETDTMDAVTMPKMDRGVEVGLRYDEAKKDYVYYTSVDGGPPRDVVPDPATEQRYGGVVYDQFGNLVGYIGPMGTRQASVAGPPVPGEATTFSLDLNELLAPEDRMKVLLWKEWTP